MNQTNQPALDQSNCSSQVTERKNYSQRHYRTGPVGLITEDTQEIEKDFEKLLENHRKGQHRPGKKSEVSLNFENEMKSTKSDETKLGHLKGAPNLSILSQFMVRGAPTYLAGLHGAAASSRNA